MSRIIRVLIQNYLYQKREEVNNREVNNREDNREKVYNREVREVNNREYNREEVNNREDNREEVNNNKTKAERRLTIERSGKYLISLFLTSSLFLFWSKEF